MPKKIAPYSRDETLAFLRLEEPAFPSGWDEFHSTLLHNLRAIETRLTALERELDEWRRR